MYTLLHIEDSELSTPYRGTLSPKCTRLHNLSPKDPTLGGPFTMVSGLLRKVVLPLA